MPPMPTPFENVALIESTTKTKTEEGIIVNDYLGHVAKVGIPGPKGDDGDRGPQGLPGVNAIENVDAVAGYVTTEAEQPNALQSALFSRFTRTFDTVADMQSALLLIQGMTCRTLGYHAAGDGGGATYRIASDGGTANGMDIIGLSNGKKAFLVNSGDVYNVKKLGAYGDDIHDDTNVFQYCAKNGVIYVPDGKYKISDTIRLSYSMIGVPTNQEYTLKNLNDYFGSILDFTGLNKDNFICVETIRNGVNLRDFIIISDSISVKEDRSLIRAGVSSEEWLKFTISNSNVTGVFINSYSCIISRVTALGFSEVGIDCRNQSFISECHAFNCGTYGINFGGDSQGVNNYAGRCITGFHVSNARIFHFCRADSCRFGMLIDGGGQGSLEGDFIGSRLCVVQSSCDYIRLTGRVGADYPIDKNSSYDELTNLDYYNYAVSTRGSSDIKFVFDLIIEQTVFSDSGDESHGYTHTNGILVESEKNVDINIQGRIFILNTNATDKISQQLKLINKTKISSLEGKYNILFNGVNYNGL